MNVAHTNAVVAVLEQQRNNALNSQVNAEAALHVAKTRIVELEKEIAQLKVVPPETLVTPETPA